MILCSAASVSAQEGAGSLANPRTGEPAPNAPVVIESEAAPPAAPQQAQPPEEQASSEFPELNEVPPPPSAAYGQPQYPAQSPAEPSREDIGISPSIATRLRVLESNLTVLGNRGTSPLNGIVSLITGGVTVGIAGWQWSENPDAASYLMVWGSSYVVRGVLELAIRPNANTRAIEYAHMPMNSQEEVMARLAYGEEALESIARRTRLKRILRGSLNMAVGALVIPVYFVPRDWSFSNPFDYLVLLSSGISVISGLIDLISRSDAERRWSAYQDLRARLENEVLVLRGVAPLAAPGGAGLAADFVF